MTDEFTHFDARGQAAMVDVGSKPTRNAPPLLGHGWSCSLPPLR